MTSRRALLIATFILALLAAGYRQAEKLREQTTNREVFLNTIRTKLAEEQRYRPAPLPADASVPLAKAMGPGLAKTFMTPFPDGLVLTPRGERGFTIEEPRPRQISFFRKDRLIATDTDPPRWQRGGRPATVPPP